MKLVKLGDLCNFFNGGAWTQNEFSNTGCPVLKVSNCKNSGFEIDDISYIPHEIAQRSEHNKLFVGDVIIATVGSHPNLIESAAGRSCIVTKKVEGFYLNQNAVCLRSKDTCILDQRYLGYLATSQPFTHYIQSRGKGAANQMRIAIGAIKDYQFMLPNVDIQRRLGSILGSFDDLIENNQKQIKLLEEAAQRLYKEWFVDLRFPGYENAPIVDGVPEGWHIAKLSDVATVNAQSISKQYSYEFVDYVDLSAVSNGHIEATARFSIQEAPGRAKRVASDGDIIWGMVRPNLKSYALVLHPTETNIFSTGFAVLSAKKVPFSFLYCYVTADNFVSYLINCTNGAAYPAVKPIHFEDATLSVPSDDILNQFHRIAEPMYRKIEVLEKQLFQAKEARDRLLPKLMNREIEV